MPPPTPSRAEAARRASAKASSLAQARAAVEAQPIALAEPSKGPGTGDPLIGDLRRAGLLPLLVLHYVSLEPRYGNQLIDLIGDLTGGALAVNPNTMYPLLRALEARGFIEGEWEHPERRSRRFYRITDRGIAECSALKEELVPRLDRISHSIESIRAEVLG